VGGLSRGLAPPLLLALALACASPPSTLHTVREGENLYRIAGYYRVPVSDIVEANAIDDVRDLRPGEVLRIPGSERGPAPVALRPPAGVRPSEDSPLLGQEEAWVEIRGLAELRLAAQQEAGAVGNAFHWPLRGRVTSRFGRRENGYHRGIDIGGAKGAAIRAAEDGHVVFSGRRADYGKLVIVGHRGGFRTWYAHNDENHVEEGDRVERGDVIAEVGATGNASGPHLHFEVHRDRRPRDPLLFLLDAH